jgi:hypothetical protein
MPNGRIALFEIFELSLVLSCKVEHKVLSLPVNKNKSKSNMPTMQIPVAIEQGIERMVAEAEGREYAPPEQIQVVDSPDELRERILDGLNIASAYADRLADEAYAAAVRDKLTRSNVRGSRVQGINSFADVQRLFESTTNWMVVDSPLTEKGITCIQGTIADEYRGRAYAAYGTVREINQRYGAAGLGMIQAKQGNQKEGEFYFCTVLPFPTDVLTVQLKYDPNGGFEHLHQWFAGPEQSSIMRMDDGDTIVRCGVQIPYINDPKTRHAKQAKSRNKFSHNS